MAKHSTAKATYFAELLTKVDRGLTCIERGALYIAVQPFELVQDFERLGSVLQRLRRELPSNSPQLATFEDSFSQAWSRMARCGAAADTLPALPWVIRYRLIWRSHLSLFLFTLSLFLVSCVVGLFIGLVEPDFVTLLAPQQILEQVLDGKAWFESIQQNPLLHGLMIAWNNMRVALNAFLLGALLGLGGLVVLCFNGLHLGAIFGFCITHNFSDALGRFVLAHGPLELSIIICSAFASMVYGRAFYTRPYSKFGEHFREGAGHAATIALGTIPWLILAATIEAFLSPFPEISVGLRITVGLAASIGFWGWTFWPVNTGKTGHGTPS